MNLSLKTVILIDVANALGADYRRVIARAGEIGRVEEVRAYGDFRQRHLDSVAIELYALGVRLLHCPSWPNGVNAAGERCRKRTDDRVLEKEVRDLLNERPDLEQYILVTADADIIPSINAIRAAGRQVKVMHPVGVENVGFVLRMCDVHLEAAPMVTMASPTSTLVSTNFSRNGGGDS